MEVFTGTPSYAFDQSTSTKTPSREQIHNIKVRRTKLINMFSKRIRAKAILSLLFFLRASLHIIKHGYKKDLVIFTSAPPFLPWLGNIAHKLFKKPCIYIVYDVYPDVLTTLNVMPKNHWLIKMWQKFNCYTWKDASNIVVLDDSMKQLFEYRYPQTKNKIKIIHNWADENKIIPKNKKDNWFAEKYDLVDQFTVIYSGNMGRCHDMETIVEAAKFLQSAQIKFLMIGGGAKYSFIEEQIEKFQLDNILLLPYQDKEVLPYSLTAGDLLLISMDKDMDGIVSPSKLYSALATGLPTAIVCPEQSFLHSLIKKVKCGETFANGESKQLADFILLLQSNPELAKVMGKAGREYFISHFTKDIAREKYMEMIEKVIC
ncbi:MAG: glycosyltransferase family 4 protein [Cyanobacterium sp.]